MAFYLVDLHLGFGELNMRFLLGIIFGAFLTIAGAYLYDSATTGTDVSATASIDRPMVNWDVVNRNWHQLEVRLRAGWNKLAANN